MSWRRLHFRIRRAGQFLFEDTVYQSRPHAVTDWEWRIQDASIPDQNSWSPQRTVNCDQKMLLLDSRDVGNSATRNCTIGNRRRPTQRNSRRAGKSRNGDHDFSEVQRPTDESSFEVVRSGASCEGAASGHEARLSRYLHLLLPLVLERSRARAWKVSMGYSRSGTGGHTQTRTHYLPGIGIRERDVRINRQTRTEESGSPILAIRCFSSTGASLSLRPGNDTTGIRT
jgi:hypothetical protein